MGDDEDQSSGTDRFDSTRFAYGVAIGPPIGVVLALLLDNWAMLGVGVALGAAIGAALAVSEKPADDT